MCNTKYQNHTSIKYNSRKKQKKNNKKKAMNFMWIFCIVTNYFAYYIYVTAAIDNIVG
mgnify:CR=1 FL=1